MPGPAITVVGTATGVDTTSLTFNMTVGSNQTVYLWVGGRIIGTTSVTYSASGAADSWEVVAFDDDTQEVHQFGFLKGNNPTTGSVTVNVIGRPALTLGVIAIAVDSPSPTLAYKIFNTGAVDSADVSTSLPVAAANSTVAIIGTARMSDLTLPTGYTTLLPALTQNPTGSTSGQTSYFWAATKDAAASEGTVTVGGTLSSARDWTAIAIAVAGVSGAGGYVPDDYVPENTTSVASWWNGSAQKSANFVGWWKGTDFDGANILGWWNGLKIVPLITTAPTLDLPDAPVLGVPTVSGSTVALAWNSVDTATGYGVYRGSTQVAAVAPASGTGSAGTPVTVTAGTSVSTSATDALYVDVSVPTISSTEISVLAVTSTSPINAVQVPTGYTQLSSGIAGSDTNLVTFYRKGPVAAATVRVNSGQAAVAGGTTVTSPSSGVYITPSRLMSLPASGAEWAKMVSASSGTVPPVNFSDNNDLGDTTILAAALVGVRTNDSARIAKAKTAIDQSVNSSFARVLEMSRNVPSFVFAMDVMGYKPAAVMNFLASLRTKALQGHDKDGLLGTALYAANNWGSMARAAMAAIDVFAGGHAADLKEVSDTLRQWLGENPSGHTDHLVYSGTADGADWFAPTSNKRGVNQRGATIDGHNFDGIQPEDQRRTGGYKLASDGHAANGWPPAKGSYPWESLQGVLMAAVALDRAGLMPFDAGDQAIKRAATWLVSENDNPASGDDLSSPWILNYYGMNLATSSTTSPGKNNAWGAWLWAGSKAANETGGSSGGGTSAGSPAVPARITVTPFKLSGADMNNPFPLDPITAIQDTGTAAVAPSLNAPSSGLLMSVFGLRGTATGTAPTVTPPAGMTEVAEKSSTASGVINNTVEVSTLQVAAGNTGTKSATATASGPSAGASIFVRPADLGGVVGNTFTDTKLVAGTYSYTVRAVNAAGDGPASNARSVTISAGRVAPAVPTGVTATVPSGGNDVTVSWSPVTDADSYTVYRGTTVVGTNQTGTSYLDMDLVAGTYAYTVRAINTVGTSAASSSASVTIAATATAPSAPTGVTADAGTTSVTISWNAVTGATSYDVYRGTTRLRNVTTTSTIDTGLAAGTYTYTVRALNAGGTSPSSASDSATITGADATGGKGVGLEDPIDITAAPPANAKYLSPSGSDSGTGTASSPWKTWQTALGKLRGGDTLIVRGGTYDAGDVNLTMTRGTNANPIMIRCYPGEKPVFVGLFWLKEQSYTTFAGITFTWKTGSGDASHMVKIKDGVGWRMTKCEIYGAKSYACLAIQSDINGEPLNARVDSCTIHDTANVHNANQDHLIYLNNSAGSTIKIERNIMYNAPGGRGVKVGPQPLTADCGGAVIRYNTIYNTLGPSNVQLSYTTKNCEIYRNVLVKTDGGPNVTMYNPSSAKGNVAHDNIGWESSKVVEMDNSQLADTGGNLYVNPTLNTSTWHVSSTYDTKYGRFATA